MKNWPRVIEDRENGVKAEPSKQTSFDGTLSPERAKAYAFWLEKRDAAIAKANKLKEENPHKELVQRIENIIGFLALPYQLSRRNNPHVTLKQLHTWLQNFEGNMFLEDFTGCNNELGRILETMKESENGSYKGAISFCCLLNDNTPLIKLINENHDLREFFESRIGKLKIIAENFAASLLERIVCRP